MNSHLSIVLNHLSRNISLRSCVRKPLIKFIGARFPRPNYDRSVTSQGTNESKSSPPPRELPFPSNVLSSTATVKAMNNQGELIEDLQLPISLRRKPISEEECHAINSGGAYGLDNT